MTRAVNVVSAGDATGYITEIDGKPVGPPGGRGDAHAFRGEGAHGCRADSGRRARDDNVKRFGHAFSVRRGEGGRFRTRGRGDA